MTSPIANIGIIGTGNIAQGGHGKAFLEEAACKEQTFRLWSVYSRDLGRAEAFATSYGAAATTSAFNS